MPPPRIKRSNGPSASLATSRRMVLPLCFEPQRHRDTEKTKDRVRDAGTLSFSLLSSLCLCVSVVSSSSSPAVLGELGHHRLLVRLRLRVVLPEQHRERRHQ